MTVSMHVNIAPGKTVNMAPGRTGNSPHGRVLGIIHGYRKTIELIKLVH